MRAILLPLLAIVLVVPPLVAEEGADQVTALLAKVEELRKARDEGGLRAEIARIPELHKIAEDPAVKASLLDALGKVLKDKKCGSARQAAAEALGQVEDKKGAWKELKGALPDVKAETAEPLDTAVLMAVGATGEEGAVKPLFEIAEKAKDHAMAKAAVDALGEFTGASRKQKAAILEEILGLGMRIKPGGSGGSSGSGKSVSQAAQERWAEVGNAILKAANKLTGRNVATWEEWEVLYKENKKQLAKLLPEE